MSKKNSILGRMGYTIPLGKMMGIPLKMHWSIFAFLLYVPALGYFKNIGWGEMLLLLIVIIFVLFSVLLHELGHAFAARKLGVKTYDIVLSLIGGVARLERIPEDPWEEFKVAIAGPLVNLLIGSILLTVLLFAFVFDVIDVAPTFANFINPDIFLNRFDPSLMIKVIYLIAISNFALFIFNLLPVFPMDGGRIFRAFLSNRMGRSRATKIASYTGKFLALVLVGFGIFYMRPIWSFIGIFVFLMADIENRQEQENKRFKSIKADALMDSVYDRVILVLPIQEVINRHFDTDMSLFLVEDSKKKIVGVIDENILQTALREKTEESPISHYMTQRFAFININDDFHSIYDALVKKDIAIGVVMDYGEVKGVIRREKLLGMVKG